MHIKPHPIAPLVFIDFFAVASKLAVQHKEKADASHLPFLLFVAFGERDLNLTILGAKARHPLAAECYEDGIF